MEGILLFNDSTLRKLLNVSIFMDTPLDICLVRRLARDVQERGRTMDSVLEQYQNCATDVFAIYRAIEAIRRYYYSPRRSSKPYRD